MPLPPAGAAVCGPPEAGQDQVSGRLAGWCTKKNNLIYYMPNLQSCVVFCGHRQQDQHQQEGQECDDQEEQTDIPAVVFDKPTFQ